VFIGDKIKLKWFGGRPIVGGYLDPAPYPLKPGPDAVDSHYTHAREPTNAPSI